MNAKTILIILIGTIAVTSKVMIDLNARQNDGMESSADYYGKMHSRNLAKSNRNLMAMKLADSSNFRMANPQQDKMFGGDISYRVVDTVLAGDTLVKVTASSDFLGMGSSVTTYYRFQTVSISEGWVPMAVRAAWTANDDLNNTMSDMFIDGRDHDLSGNLVSKTGVYGVSTDTELTNIDEAEIGGTVDSVDYPMAYPHNAIVVEDNYNWGGYFPTTPDAVLGYPEGTLKSVAQSGENGSQYINGLENFDELTFPLSGVTYVEAYPGEEEEIKIEEAGNTGLVVIHAPGATSRVKKITKGEDDPFVGLLITDYSFHHHLSVLGAVIQISPNLEQDKNCGGNKDHWVYYSSQAVKSATAVVSMQTGYVGNTVKTGANGNGNGKAIGRGGVLPVYTNESSGNGNGNGNCNGNGNGNGNGGG